MKTDQSRKTEMYGSQTVYRRCTVGGSRFAVILLFILGSRGQIGAETPDAKELFFAPASSGPVSVEPIEVLEPIGPIEPISELEAGRKSGGRRQPTPVVHRWKPNPQPAAFVNYFGLKYSIELVADPGKIGETVTEARVFRSGEKIRLHFESNRNGYISLLQLGASGQPNLLFPAPAKQLVDNYLVAGEDRILPAPEAWFRFDHQAGIERLVVVFAPKEEAVASRLPSRNDRAPARGENSVQLVAYLRGSKDLLIETEMEARDEIGTYAISRDGEPLVLEIELKHE